MILVDANILLYAANRSAPEHERARRWLDDRLAGQARVGLPWPSLLAFVRIVTNPVAVRNPTTVKAAWRQAEAWLECPTVWTPVPGPDHARLLRRLLGADDLSSRLVPDAHLAALALEHGLTLCSADADFARFPDLRVENPLAAI